MTNDEQRPAADGPRMKADVWAHAKATPDWQLAAARLVHAWPPAFLLTESDFDDAVQHIQTLTSG